MCSGAAKSVLYQRVLIRGSMICVIHTHTHIYTRSAILTSCSPTQVGKQTVETSKDEILKKDMPPTFVMVEDASSKLVEASEGLSVDQSSQPHHVLLLEGARGIW